MPRKEDIIYPVFLECIKFTDDSFWENVFKNLAYGKAPRGSYINKDFLCCGFKGREFTYKIERKDPQILYNDVTTLLTEKLKIFSQKQKLQNMEAFYSIEKNINDTQKKWSDIRTKNIKDMLFQNYVINMKKKHSLTLTQSKYLLSLIMSSVVFKIIVSKDIEYVDGEIQNISGIEFSKQGHKCQIILTKNFCQDYSVDDINISDEEDECPRMADNWSRYLKNLK